MEQIFQNGDGNKYFPEQILPFSFVPPIWNASLDFRRNTKSSLICSFISAVIITQNLGQVLFITC